MKKKLVGMLLCVAMTAAMVAGCGDKKEEAKDDTAKTEDEAKDDAADDAGESDGTITVGFSQVGAESD